MQSIENLRNVGAQAQKNGTGHPVALFLSSKGSPGMRRSSWNSHLGIFMIIEEAYHAE